MLLHCIGLLQHVTRQHRSTLLSIFMQESKRSAQDLCGRTDGNMKVIFPKEDVSAQHAESNGAPVNAGDYVLVKVVSFSKVSHLVTFFI